MNLHRLANYQLGLSLGAAANSPVIAHYNVKQKYQLSWLYKTSRRGNEPRKNAHERS